MSITENLIRSLFGQRRSDKLFCVDEYEVDALPPEIRRVIIYGTDSEAEALVRSMLGNLEKAPGEAALELLYEMREFARQRND